MGGISTKRIDIGPAATERHECSVPRHNATSRPYCRKSGYGCSGVQFLFPVLGISESICKALMTTWRRLNMVSTSGNDEDDEELISAGVGLLLIVSFTAFYNLAWWVISIPMPARMGSRNLTFDCCHDGADI